MNATTQPKPSLPQVLDARSLGRPVHLLDGFAAHVRGELEALFRELLNRRYRASYTLGPISIEPPGSSQAPAAAWWSAETGQGLLACQLDRALVLSVMAYRYGSAQASADVETATEERLVKLLAEQVLHGLASRLGAETAEAVQRSPAPAKDAWRVRIPVQEAQQGLDATLNLALDGAWMNRLLRAHAPARSQGKAATPLPRPQELPSLLKLKLVARLAQTELPLGELLDLRPGTVIPVSLKATEVLVDGSRLFTASVAEHQGKLCLTSFEDAH